MDIREGRHGEAAVLSPDGSPAGTAPPPPADVSAPSAHSRTDPREAFADAVLDTLDVRLTRPADGAPGAAPPGQLEEIAGTVISVPGAARR
jgi:hypothetical protein